jgi:hypothetical protein
MKLEKTQMLNLQTTSNLQANHMDFAERSQFSWEYGIGKRSISKRRNFLEREKERPFHNEIRSRLNSVDGSICAQQCTNNARERECVSKEQKRTCTSHFRSEEIGELIEGERDQ